ncbi:FecR family protein [Pseudomonas nitroreducens]|uniref:FecR family protein n=1 Tax=Pseudomonas nitroreducens TaxID=46680 RepID=UPI00209CE978|nr:FecR family protein [Pseudomonas nitroreducens]MCP1623718.1 transmembrane sensor [Pseudomonas nitroreducens]
MTSSPAPFDDDRISAEAAHWCARLHDEECSDAERAEFAQWLALDTRHEVEYQAMLEIWQLSELLPPTPRAIPAPIAPTPLSDRRPRTSRRPRSGKRIAAVAAGVLVAIGAVWSAGWSAGWLPSKVGYYAAQPGTREVQLADGSTVELNSNSQLFFADFRDRRSAWLKSGGEAYFRVVHDTLQPFSVYTDNGSVRVTGTRFNVWTDSHQMLVTLLEGSVVVSPPDSVDGNSAQLTPGMQARFTQGSQRIELAQVAPAGAIAWIEGKLVIDDLTLQSAIPLINRYLKQPVFLDDATVAAMRIGGIYRTDDLQALVDSLPKVLPLELRKDNQGRTVLASRYVSL